MELAVSNCYPALREPQGPTESLIHCLQSLPEYALPPGELSIVFVDDPAIATIHAQFMDDPSPTDVITFPPAPEMQSAGEIIVSVDHARARAAELNIPFARELALYLAHGWLHLLGYDDRNEPDRKKMRAAENTLLNALDQLPQFPDFQFEGS
ncbi:MAG: rRNA maturation RNase YbeY [Verrucomicrobia bacterium]|nr:rRNA maturation RNase YbeY [Verrucomicrobiota bacterium]